MGPVFTRTTTLGAAGTAQPLQTVPAWTHRFLSEPSIIEFALICTAVDGTYNVALGAQLEVQESAIPGGGTLGLYVNFNDTVKTIVGDMGDEIAFTYTLLGADSVMLEIHLTPIDE